MTMPRIALSLILFASLAGCIASKQQSGDPTTQSPAPAPAHLPAHPPTEMPDQMSAQPPEASTTPAPRQTTDHLLSQAPQPFGKSEREPIVTKADGPDARSRGARAQPQTHRLHEEARRASNAVAVRDIAVAAPLHSAHAQDELIERHAPVPENTEKYQAVEDNPIHAVSEQPVSTFSIDVDTGAYANVRRFLSAGQLPPRDAVRVEELINYFPYAYAGPAADETPFAVHTETAQTPWNADTLLMRIAIKGKDVAKAALPPANLVFLIDVSGSMDEPRKLPLLKEAFKLFTRELRAQDRVSMVVYAGASGVVLEPTPGSQQERILTALDRLSAGGSTHGAAGIELAYRMAQKSFIPGGINRVLLATDGDFNVGVTDFSALKSLVEQKRRSGVSLSTLGFGTGNYNDHLMEQLADAGNGQYSYIDTINEGRKTLVEEFTSTLATIAKDVKIQIEFNPAVVAEYRLIGYENRALRREDFNNDRIDAGEIGAGHTVTALYEMRLHGHGKSLIDPLRYQKPQPTPPGHDELANLRLRYKQPDADDSQLIEVVIGAQETTPRIERASADLRFATAVAAFAQELKGGKYLGKFSFDQIAGLARSAMGNDRFGYRAEFLELVDKAARLSHNPPIRLGTTDD